MLPSPYRIRTGMPRPCEHQLVGVTVH